MSSPSRGTQRRNHQSRNKSPRRSPVRPRDGRRYSQNTEDYFASPNMEQADRLMWLDFETKIRTTMGNMITPLTDMVTDNRCILKRVEDTNAELASRVLYLEQVVLYNRDISNGPVRVQVAPPSTTQRESENSPRKSPIKRKTG
jgi:hypothetical protein